MDREFKKIIFFDGKCNLCDRFVNFIFKRDKSKQFFYAPLQGETAKKLLEEEDFQTLKSILFLKDGVKFKESRAIAEIMSLIYPKTTRAFKFLPYGFYDIFYNLVARKRYHLLGKKSDLYVPLEVQKRYFLP